jgi:hypothetical protein
MMEMIYVEWAVLVALFFVVLAALTRRESKAVRRDESALDPMFKSPRTVTKKRFL